MAIKVTPTAVKELKRVLSEQQIAAGTALRVGVTGGGCSGFEYKLGFDEHVSEETDLVTEVDGIRVAIDNKSALYLDGTELDYHESFEKRGFVFNNPNATKSCGCGSSFSA